jgi:hypothetical protein
VSYVRGLVLLIVPALVLTACDQVNTTMDKASACSQALGLTNLNLDPTTLADEAGQKADQLRQLAQRVSDQDLKQNLFLLADSYVDLEKRKADGLAAINDWIQGNSGNFAKLRSICF